MPRSHSLWQETTKSLTTAPLQKHARANVCVVGAGIAGLTTAYQLAREGRSVIVIDAVAIGGGQTSATTADLSNAIDDSYEEILRLHGPDGARLACDSHRAAIDRIQAICQLENLECAFERVDGYLFLGFDSRPLEPVDGSLRSIPRPQRRRRRMGEGKPERGASVPLPRIALR